MDVASSAAVIVGLQTVGKPAAEVVKDFLGRILAPTGDAIGQAIADPIREWHKRRIDRGTNVLLEAAKRIADSQQPPTPVPARLLFPILEKASLEEDDSLRERWTALLVQATTGHSVLPAFVTILGELSPLEARVLTDWFLSCRLEDRQHLLEFPTGLYSAMDQQQIRFDMQLVIQDNLIRLRLFRPNPPVLPGHEFRSALNEQLGNNGVAIREVQLEDGSHHGLILTSLGLAFLESVILEFPER